MVGVACGMWHAAYGSYAAFEFDLVFYNFFFFEIRLDYNSNYGVKSQ